ncbi:MAG: glycosyltransferase family 87 protein [Sphingomicrobium sp.]
MDAPLPPLRAPFRAAPLPALLWIGGLLAALGLYWLDIGVARSHPGLSINGHALWGRDFANLWSAGRLVIEGRTGLLYDVPAYQSWQVAHLGRGIVEHNYSYPPISLLYAPLFGALPYLAGLALWSALSVGAFLVAARPWLARSGLGPWWALALPATIVCLWAGHYGLIFAALWLFAWEELDARPGRAGVAIGLMLIKPHLAILMPLVLMRRGAWRAIGAAALTVGLLVGLSILLFGTGLWRTYLTATSSLQLTMVGSPDMLWSFMMPTLPPALLATAMPSPLAWAMFAVVAALVVGLLLWRLPPDRHEAAMLTAVATILVLPYAFNYDLTIVAVAALLLFARAARSGNRVSAWIAAASLALPSTMVYLAAMGFRIAPFVLGAQFVAMIRRRE